MVAVALILRPYSRAFVALALIACGRPDRSNTPSSTQSGSVAVARAGPQALVLRVPRGGGAPRVFSYPRADSAVWTATDSAPRPAEVLAFDHEGGNIAYVDTRGRPVLLGLRLGEITVASTKKLTGLASADGRSIYGIAANGDVLRMTPTGDWTFKPPQPASAVFPQPAGGLLVAIGRGANTRLISLYPPEARIRDSIAFPVATRTVRTQLGDRVYLAVDSGLVVLRTRTMDWGPTIPFDEPIARMASTPSGDRVFVLTDSGRQISVVDRFRDRVTARINLPVKAEDLRIDPFGRYLLARAAKGDSIWVAAIGTQRVIGGIRGTWRSDLPFVGYDGTVAVADGADVVLLDGETLKPRSRIKAGAQDYWYPFLWDGFRPRAASLDEPVRFDSFALDTVRRDSLGLPIGGDSTVITSPPPTPPTRSDTVVTAPRGFMVSFAALLSEDRAKEMAARIHVGGENARVIATTSREGATIYRVVLGPFLSHDEADRAGKESGMSYWVYEGLP